MTITTKEQIFPLVYSNGGNNPATIVFHEDGGHGWLQVPVKLVKELGFPVSTYSYTDGKNVYLEEDCDLSKFMNAIGITHSTQLNKDFWSVCPNEYADHSPIRNLPRYKG